MVRTLVRSSLGAIVHSVPTVRLMQSAHAKRSHKVTSGADTAAQPPVTFVFVCRNECELAVLLPLLPYTAAITICVYYTGAAPLQPQTLTAAHAGGTDAADAELGQGKTKSASSEFDDAHRSGSVAAAALPKLVSSRALALTVWIVCLVTAFWSVVRC